MKEPGKKWARPVAGRRISGVALALARGTGLPVGWVRAALLVDLLLGVALAVAAALFDHLLPGGPLAEGTRVALIALGVAGVLAYPALALLLPDAHSPRRWDFGSVLGVVLLLVAVGQALGFLLQPYARILREAVLARGAVGWLSWPELYAERIGFGLQDLVLVAFFASAAAFVVLQRRAIVRFFRAMETGVTLVALVIAAVAAGVLVPQIDGFEDPDQRVDMAAEREDYELFRRYGYQKLPAQLVDGHEQYQAFRWAEGYFLYHVFHLYGIGMPEARLTPSMEEGLERFGRRYGYEEAANREKQMRAAFSGREKIEEIGAFIHRNEEFFWRFFRVSTALQLNRTYKSAWFASLLALLGIGVFLSGYKSWRYSVAKIPAALAGGAVAAAFAIFLKLLGAIAVPWGECFAIAAVLLAAALVLGPGVPRQAVSLQKLGFFVVHNGILVLLVGGLVSKLFTDRGILQLDLEDPRPKQTYWRHFDPNKLARMPFAVRLDHFGRKDWLGLEVHFTEEEFASRPPRYTLWEGREIDLDYVEDGQGGLRPDLRVRVLELHDRAEVGLPHVYESVEGEEGGFPLAEVRLEPPGEDPERRFLLPLVADTQTFRDEVLRDPAGRFRLAAVHGAAPIEHFPAGDGRIGVLEATVVGEEDGAPRAYPVRLGDELELPGGYRLRISDASTDFRPGYGDLDGSAHPLPLAEQPYRFAAVWVDILPPDGGPSERRVVLEAIDDVQYGRQEGFFHPEVVLRFAWDDWSAPGPPRYLLHWDGSGEASLLSEGGEREQVDAGEPLPLPGSSRVVPLEFLQRATFEKNLAFPEPERGADGWDADFYYRGPRGAVLEVVRHPDTEQERREQVELASTDAGKANLWFSEDGDVVLHFLENSEMLPFEWRSVLSVFERDAAGEPYQVDLGPEREREIRVNDYLYYGGFRFFQTNASPERPTYSGIGVVYDPGIPIVLLGMYGIIAGTTIAFLVRPIVRGRARASRA